MTRGKFETRSILLRSPVQVLTMRMLLSHLPLDPDKPLEILIREQPRARGLDDNALYWLRLGEIAEQGWIHGKQFNADCWHEYSKRHIMPDEITTKDGGKRSKWTELPDGTMTVASTTILERGCFREYRTLVEVFGASLGVQFSARPA